LATGAVVAVGGGIATVPTLAKGAFNLSKLLLKVGGKAIRRLIVGRNAKEAAEYLAKIMKTEIFNEYDGWLRKWKNTKLLNKDMRFLCLGLKQRGLITSSEASEFLKVIASGRLDKSMFKSTSEARKAFKDFAMAFAHKGLISVRTLKSLAELSPADIKALENARIQTKKAMGMATTAADPTKPKTFPKYKTLPKLKTRVRF
jgi:intergrase/recombinase